MAASLLLFISAALGLSGSKEEPDPAPAGLLARGWLKTDRLPCPHAEAGKFYEIEGENESAEAYLVSPGFALAASLPLPEASLNACREIAAPHYIEEIR
jgi:hypothetical protein